MPHQLPEAGFLRLRQIIGDPKADPPLPPLIPVGKSTWWDGVRTGRFPQPVKLTPRTTAWTVESIRALIDALGKAMLALVAILIVGCLFADGTDAATGDVIIWCGEDPITDMLVPPLLAAGPWTNRVVTLRTLARGLERSYLAPNHRGETRLRPSCTVYGRVGSD